MANEILTDTKARQTKPTDKDYLIPDGGSRGLYLRVRPNGTKEWIFRYMHNGVRRKLTLGKYPTLTVAKAREAAQQERDKLGNDINPHEERQRIKAAKLAEKAIQEALPQNVEELFDLWQRRELTLRKDGGRKDNGDEVRRKFTKDVFPRIGKLPLDAVRRAHVLEILDSIKARGAPRIAGMVLTDLRQMFAFAVDREIITADPTAGLKKSKLGGNANERERVLSEDEIRQLMKALPQALGEAQQHAVWVMLATACRVGEITGARWEFVDMDAGAWLIPETKNGKPHIVTLSAFALEQFKALQRMEEEHARKDKRDVSPWVMPARHHKGGVCPRSLAKQVGDRQRGETAAMSRRSPLTDALMLPGGKWTPHDLRRTAATMMAALGVRPDVIERCLNHTIESKVQRIYQRAELRPEMAEAWRLLGERLELLSRTDVGNVVPMKPRKTGAA